MSATAAYPRLVRLVPIQVRAAATVAAQAVTLAEAAHGCHAGFLVRTYIGKNSKVSTPSYLFLHYAIMQKVFLKTILAPL